ncbi:hypothetical protein [Deinococcus sp. RM]|uniref:hypothetical protein n=1 Tax=Deinococcus sp. RM TaxID=2316359 RepID=UPI000E6A4161|nr:hypothetical protein [Deinococcus sp. RM]RIY11638.1 hypothetical protein D3W47_06000 [Deinococcus sp. RM]
MNALTAPRPLPTQTRRRHIVTVYAAGLLTAGTIFLLRLIGTFDATPPGLRAPLLILLLLAAAASLYGVLHLAFPARLGLPQGHTRDLDERQVLRVAQANSAAYRALALTVLIAAELVVLFGINTSALHDRIDAVQGFMLLVLLTLPFLPTAILAWTEPDADPQD